MAGVSFQSVRKVYGSGPAAHEAVREFSLEVAPGEFVVLVGASGCGKSTTLRMLAGLEDITSGTISIGGRVVNTVHPKDRNIAMVFQNYALYPHMTVYQNIAFPLRLAGVGRAEIDARVRDAARTLQLDSHLDRRPGALSGGQRQRVALGRAIVRKPSVFLFDEPLSNLDAKLRVVTRAELKALHQRTGTTTLYVTHDQEEAMTLGDRIVVMAGGVIQQAAPPLEVFNRPANRFVAGFIGTPPINFIDGTLGRAGPAGADGGGIEFLEPGTGGQRLALWPDRAAALDAHAPHPPHAPVTLAVRPQGLIETHSDEPANARPTLAATIQLVEPLGAETDVTAITPAGTRLVARLASSAALRPGRDIRLTLDPRHTHFFAPGEFGTALAPPPAL